MGVGEQGEHHGDMELGGGGAEMLASPSGNSLKNKAIQGSGVHNPVKDLKCFLLRLLWVRAQDPDERFKMPVAQRGETGWQNWQGVGS